MATKLELTFIFENGKKATMAVSTSAEVASWRVIAGAGASYLTKTMLDDKPADNTSVVDWEKFVNSAKEQKLATVQIVDGDKTTTIDVSKLDKKLVFLKKHYAELLDIFHAVNVETKADGKRGRKAAERDFSKLLAGIAPD